MRDSSNKIITIFVSLLILLAILIVAYAANNIIIGHKEISLVTEPPLYGQIAQTYLNGTGGNKVTTLNNYIVLNPAYLDNGSWAVAQFIPQHNQGDSASVVMQKVGPFYEVVLGPGVSFPSNVQQGLPADVYQYLSSKGLVYEIN